MWFVILPFVAMGAFTQFACGLACANKYQTTRLPAMLLAFVAPMQPLWMLLGEDVLGYSHTPSSFDAVADGFGILINWFYILVAIFGTSATLTVWLVIRLARVSPRNDHISVKP